MKENIMKKIAILLLISSSFLIQNSFSVHRNMQLLPSSAENMLAVLDTTKANLQPDSLDITKTEAADLQKLIDQVKTISKEYSSSPTIVIESKIRDSHKSSSTVTLVKVSSSIFSIIRSTPTSGSFK